MISSSLQTPAEQEEYLADLKLQFALGSKIVDGLMANQEALSLERAKLVLAIKDAAANLAFVTTASVLVLSEYRTIKAHYTELSDGLKVIEEECARNFTLLAAAQTDILQLRALIQQVESNPIDNVQELFPQ